MPASEDPVWDPDSSLEASNKFKARISHFSYPSELPPKSVTMPPRTRKGVVVAAVQGEELTGIEEKISDSRSGSEALAAVASETIPPNSQAETSKLIKKRKQADQSNESSELKKPRIPTTLSTKAVRAENNLKDSVREGLILISIGLNPGIMTGKLGHAYSHPTNRYWPTLYDSGITPVPHKPADTHGLMDLYGMGHTNIIPTIASVGASDLTTQDYLNGAAVLDAKIREFKPQAVAIVGKGIWEEWVRYKKGRKFNVKKDGFEYGWQDSSLWIGRKDDGDDAWQGARTFVVTTTSGASTAHTKEQRIAIWKPLGEWFAPKRDEWMKSKQEQKDQLSKA